MLAEILSFVGIVIGLMLGVGLGFALQGDTDFDSATAKQWVKAGCTAFLMALCVGAVGGLLGYAVGMVFMTYTLGALGLTAVVLVLYAIYRLVTR